MQSLNSFIGFEQLHLEVILSVATKLNWQIVWVEQFTLALDLNFVESQHFHQIKVLYHKLQGAHTCTSRVNIGRFSAISRLAPNTDQKSCPSTTSRSWFTSLKWVGVTGTKCNVMLKTEGGYFPVIVVRKRTFRPWRCKGDSQTELMGFANFWLFRATRFLAGNRFQANFKNSFFVHATFYFNYLHLSFRASVDDANFA